MMEVEAGITGFVIGFVIALVLGAVIGVSHTDDRIREEMNKVHATLEARCVEGEQYSRDLLECVIPRHGR